MGHRILQRRAAACALTGALVAGALVAGGGAGAQTTVDPFDPFVLTPTRAHVAEIIRPTAVRSAPGAGRITGRQGTVAPWGRGPVRLLVLASALAPDGTRWLQVRLPTRPNDASGWIDRDSARLSSTALRIEVSLADRTLTLLSAGRRQWRTRVVIGKRATPTPTGLFAVSEEIRQPKGEDIGPWALHLTAHSTVLENFGGGPGRVAIHGREGALLADPLGSARSHGCIRIPSRRVTQLARRLQAGTPVLVY